MRSPLAFVALLGLAASLSACAYYPDDSYYGQEYPPPAPPPEQYGPPPGAAEYAPPPSAEYYGPPAPARAYYRPVRRHGPKWCANHPHRCAKARGVYAHPVEEQPPPE